MEETIKVGEITLVKVAVPLAQGCGGCYFQGFCRECYDLRCYDRDKEGNIIESYIYIKKENK